MADRRKDVRGVVAAVVLLVVALTAAQSGAVASVRQPTPSVPPITLSGTGQEVTDEFALTDGLAVVRSECVSCTGNFIVEILDDRRQVKDLVVNRTGSYEGSKGVGVSAGDHVLQVDADAPWTVEITQPGVPSSAAALPQSWSGSSDRLEGPFEADRAVTVAATHTGDGTFVVTVVDSEGRAQDLVFNEIRDFGGSAVARMRSEGPYYVNVTSEGTWSLTLTEP
ncbi:hypothetical protein AB0903_31285 [Streptomyces sp. NPDC048389]|uniref:hypothetical protein n=1 Tax=Streptomyces sp. NPDC048389 TaxID=3154622 RepID=UPI00345221EB